MKLEKKINFEKLNKLESRAYNLHLMIGQLVPDRNPPIGN